MMTLKNFWSNLAPFALLSLLAPLLIAVMPANADSFKVTAGPPTVSPITLSENNGDVFTSIQPAYTTSSDRYNVSLSAAFPGGHDDLEKITMCWYLVDFDDCSDTTKLANEPEIVFKATQSVTRDGEGSAAEIIDEAFSVVGDNNYEVNIPGFESSTSVTREAADSVNVDITFTFSASNAMRASSNWKVYVEVEDSTGQTDATSRDGIKVDYFAAMTLDRENVNFGGVEKGATSQVNNIDSGEYTANAQSQFFIDAEDFMATVGAATKTLPIITSGTVGPNQVELRCSRAADFSTASIMVTKAPQAFGSSISPSSETPVDASDHSCSVRFGQGQANNPNLTYTNTFTLAISASPVTAPQDLEVTADVVDPASQAKVAFNPPSLIVDNLASIESYRIQVVNTSTSTTEQTIRVPLVELEQGALGFDSGDTTRTSDPPALSLVISDLDAGSSYDFIVEASTTKGDGSVTGSLTTGTTSLFDFSLATFTPGGNTGQSGPTLAQVLSGIDGATSSDYLSVTNGVIEWTVPEDGTYRITANGASGGTHVRARALGQGNYDSYGASMRGDFYLTKDSVLRMVVGQRGEDSGTYYSNLASNSWEGDNAAPGGGGGTFVFTDTSADGLLLAAGGGAGGTRNNFSGVNASLTTSAKNSQSNTNGGTNGNGGGVNNSGGSYWAGGGAGWLTDGTGGRNALANDRTPSWAGAQGGQAIKNGGLGGTRWSDGTDSGGNGGFGGGGGGGSDNMGTGGGGGYSGGSGGSSSPANSGGGGGGSFISEDASNTSSSLRDVVAHGSVTIQLLP